MVTNAVNEQRSGQKKGRSELAIRVVSAVAMIAAALTTAWLGGWIFAAFWAAAAVAVFWEWVRMSGSEGVVPRLALVGVVSVTLLALAAIPHLSVQSKWYFAGLALAFALIACLLGRSLRDKKWIVWGILYAAVIGYFPNFLRELPGYGLSNILWVFAVVWGTDIAAYFVGRTLGGPKLWPRVSPNKTWSGFCGGLVAGTGAGAAIVLMLQQGTSQLHWLLIFLFSAIASILSQGGDLAESALKRRFGFKDSSFLIPGHGGVMDRLDGFWSAVFFLGMCLIVTHAVHQWVA